jgi:hypothetical protein
VSGELVLSEDARSTAGILLLTIVAVEYGGTFMLRVVRGRVPMTPFQKAFARAGHAHAGVLVLAALICQVLADAAELNGFQGILARGAFRSRRSRSRPASSSPRWGEVAPSRTG